MVFVVKGAFESSKTITSADQLTEALPPGVMQVRVVTWDLPKNQVSDCHAQFCRFLTRYAFQSFASQCINRRGVQEWELREFCGCKSVRLNASLALAFLS